MPSAGTGATAIRDWEDASARYSASNSRAAASTGSPVAESVSSPATRSEEHTSELQSIMRISYAVFCLKKKKTIIINTDNNLVLSTALVHKHHGKQQHTLAA